MDLFEHARNVARIRELNDAFRTTFIGGDVYLTEGLRAQIGVVDVIEAVQRFSHFTPHNDPHGEHDGACFGFKTRNYFWRIEYFDLDMKGASPDPADEDVTLRVLTIGLCSEL